MHRLRNIFVISEGCIFSKYCSLSLFVEFLEKQVFLMRSIGILFQCNSLYLYFLMQEDIG